MSVCHLQRLLTSSAHTALLSARTHVPSHLPRMLRSCIHHLCRISSLPSGPARTVISPYVLQLDDSSSSVRRQFSGSSSVSIAVKKPVVGGGVGGRSKGAAAEQTVQVFDQRDMLVGQMSLRAAEKLARGDNLRLVDMGDNPDKLRSFRMVSGRQLAEESKRQRTEKKSERVKEKEFRLTSKITDHDLDIKVRQAKEALTGGGNVKFVIKAHRRSAEEESSKMISQLMKKITSQLKDCAVVKQGIRTSAEQQLLLTPLSPSPASDP